MEVHQHTHPEVSGRRKKWTHYFWEFLMLFLAVFCGFLAENQREHFVEGKREKKFMQMMLEDLKQDTAELNRVANVSFEVAKYIDVSLSLLYHKELSDSNIINLYKSISGCITTVRTDLQDRTSAQLKNAGNLRLIRKKNVGDSLANYWYLSDILQNTNQVNYEADRKIAKDIMFGLINLDNYRDSIRRREIKDDKNPELVNDDFAIRVKLGNYLSNMRSQLRGVAIFSFNGNRKRMEQAGHNLIRLIKQEYHLE